MNTEGQNLYLISDLAEQVGVPRTTITDWLGKYSRFMELQIQGRRRYYTSRSLSVLCKVAELRNAGRSIGDIDVELERIFSIHPTIVPQGSNDSTTGNSGEGQDRGQGQSVPQEKDAQQKESEISYALARQEKTDELLDLMGTRFTDLCTAFTEIERKSNASAKWIRIMLAIAVLAIVLLVGVLVMFYAFFRAQQKDIITGKSTLSALEALSLQSAERENGLQTNVESLSGEISGVAGNVTGLSEQMEALKRELPEQRKAFDAAIREIQNNNSKTMAASQEQFEARLAMEKEAFASERLVFLQQIDELKQQIRSLEENEPARTQELSQLRQLLLEARGQEREIEKLRRDYSGISEQTESLREKNRLLSNELSEARQKATNEELARKKAEEETERVKVLLETTSKNRNNAKSEEESSIDTHSQK